MRYVFGQQNVMADMMSRWSGHIPTKKGTNGFQKVGVKEVNVMGEEEWRRLHGDHFGLSTMVHICERT